MPARVVITEYVDVAAAFLARDEVGMVNAVRAACTSLEGHNRTAALVKQLVHPHIRFVFDELM